MNPETTIKSWLLACGKQFGINEAHEYRRPDDDTRQPVSYCTYRSIDGNVELEGILDMTTEGDDNTVHRKGVKQFFQNWQIDLHNSQDGLYELEAFCVGAEHIPAILQLFDDGSCALVGFTKVTNLTNFSQSEIKYHFRLTCAFREWVEISLEEVDSAVDEIRLTLDSDSPTFSTKDSGVTVL